MINVTVHGILRINRSLDFNKARGHDDIFIRIFKIPDKTILEPLRIVFTQEYSQIYGKNLILFQCTKKINILLPILGKNFEKKNCVSTRKQLVCENQCGFRPSDSCKYQLLSVVHEIYVSFDCNPSLDVRAVF